MGKPRRGFRGGRRLHKPANDDPADDHVVIVRAHIPNEAVVAARLRTRDLLLIGGLGPDVEGAPLNP
jgi:hypothetical protein